MKHNFVFCILVLLTGQLFAQKVTVGARSSKISNENADGYSSDLDANSDEVKISLGKFLKETGKAKNSGETITITEPVINGTVYNKGFLYATVSGSDVKTRVWIGINKSQWSDAESGSILKELEQMVYRFGIKYYRDKIQAQIDEAQQAADAVTKQSQRTTNEGKSLANKLQSNDQEKVRLEKALEANKLEDLVLKQKIVNNKKSLDSLSMATEKINIVIQGHKERQGKVN